MKEIRKQELLIKETDPLTDLDMALPNMEKPEVMAAKKPLFSFFFGLPIFFFLSQIRSLTRLISREFYEIIRKLWKLYRKGET